MKNLKGFKIVVAIAVFFMAMEAFAQPGACTPAPMQMGQPQRCWDGRIIPPVNAFEGQNPYQGMMGQWGGQQVMIPQGIGADQPFSTVVNGQRMRCSIKDRAATAVVDGLGAGLVAGGVAKLLGSNRAKDIAIGGALAGAGYGATLGCEPTMIDDNEVVAQGFSQRQQVAQQAVPQCNPPANSPGSVPGVLNLPGNPMHGKTVCAMPGDPNIGQWF